MGTVEELLKDDSIDLNNQDKLGNSSLHQVAQACTCPLFWTTFSSSFQLTRVLFTRCLLQAALFDRSEMVKIFMERGAKADIE